MNERLHLGCDDTVLNVGFSAKAAASRLQST
jgi:hypothetical protein